MARKADFNAEQWDAVVAGPPAAGLIVIAADRGGVLKESLSIARAYQEARGAQGGNGLIDDLVASPPPVQPVQARSADQLRTDALQRLRDAVAAVQATGDAEDLDAYRAFVLGVAQRAAEASKEGGILGIGGERVSAAEREAIDEIGRALGTPAPL